MPAKYERGKRASTGSPSRTSLRSRSTSASWRKQCDFAKLDVAFIDADTFEAVAKQLTVDFNPELTEDAAWKWQPLLEGENHELMVPPGAHGLLRMSWESRARPTLPSTSAPTCRCAPPPASRDFGVVRPRVFGAGLAGEAGPGRRRRARAARDHQGRVHGVVRHVRDSARFTVKEPSDDPLFKIDVQPLTDAECASLQSKLRRDKTNTRVRCAFHVTVQVHEQDEKGMRQLDQGPLFRPLEIVMDDAAGEMPYLLVQGIVRGDWVVGGVEDQGKVKLKSFRAGDGTKKSVAVWTDHKTELAVDHHTPSGIEVKVRESPKESTPTRASGSWTSWSPRTCTSAHLTRTTPSSCAARPTRLAASASRSSARPSKVDRTRQIQHGKGENSAVSGTAACGLADASRRRCSLFR